MRYKKWPEARGRRLVLYNLIFFKLQVNYSGLVLIESLIQFLYIIYTLWVIGKGKYCDLYQRRILICYDKRIYV